MMTKLPIDAAIPDIQNALQNHQTLLIQAEPGSGKTTRIPLALRLKRKTAVIEPRRLAAKLPAAYAASQAKIPLGSEIGYQVRFDSRVQPSTRVIYMTEGVFVRQLWLDPLLQEYDLIILDEFHERRLDTDLILAWVRYLQKALRPDLRLMLSSSLVSEDWPSAS